MERAGRMHWRFYRSPGGASPVEDFISARPEAERQAIQAAMRRFASDWEFRSARRVGDVWEIRATAPRAHFRILFSRETRVLLLALDVFDKDTDKTPENVKATVRRRLADWRSRADG